MKQQIDQMMRAGAVPEQLAVEHQRQARHRMPVGHHHGPEGPGDTRRRQTLLNVGIFGYIGRVIQIDEIVSAQRPKYGRRNQKKRKINYPPTTHLEIQIE